MLYRRPHLAQKTQLLTLILAGFFCSFGQVFAQQEIETITPTSPLSAEEQKERQEQYVRSMNYMLKRAKLTRQLAAQHMVYVSENADKKDAKKIEDASQLVAFDFVCADDVLKPEKLDEIATEASYRIAVLAGRSPITPALQDLGKQQTIGERMELLGDVTSTTFMFMVGRRRGLFDSLITDFGESKFCDGMRANMRGIYAELNAPEAQATE